MSGQTQPGTALQALAEKLRTDAIAIFGEGQAERDIIEWFYGAILAAAPATPAAQGAVPDVSAMAKVLSDRAASACCVDPDDNWKIYGQEYIEDVRAMLSASPKAPVSPSKAVIGIDLAEGAIEGAWRDAIIDHGWTPPGQAPAAQKWIACSERLPDDGVQVLAAYTSGFICTARKSVLAHDLACDEPKFGERDRPTHWMPLPAAPALSASTGQEVKP